MIKSKFIKRTFNIRKSDDKKLEKAARSSDLSKSHVLRLLIALLNEDFNYKLKKE